MPRSPISALIDAPRQSNFRLRASFFAAIITTAATPDSHPDCRALLIKIAALQRWRAQPQCLLYPPITDINDRRINVGFVTTAVMINAHTQALNHKPILAQNRFSSVLRRSSPWPKEGVRPVPAAAMVGLASPGAICRRPIVRAPLARS
jgi:hypothetical protein